MKLIALTAAGLLAAGALTPTPAEAQRWGYNDGRGWNDGRGVNRGRNWDRGRGWDRRRNWNRNRGWNGNRGWNRNRGWNNGFYGRPRVQCRIVRGWYGPERRCFQVWR